MCWTASAGRWASRWVTCDARQRSSGEQAGVRLRHMVKTLALPLLHGSGALWLANKLDRGERQIAFNYHNVEPKVFADHVAFLQKHATVVDLDSFLAGPSGSLTKPFVTITFDDGYSSFMENIVSILATFKLPATWFVPTMLVGTKEVFWFDRVRAGILSTPREEFEFQGRQWKLHPWNREYVAAAICTTIKQADPAQQGVLVTSLVERLGEAQYRYLRRFQLVSQDRLRSLAPTLITIGSHSHTHPQLSQLGADMLATELTTSKKLLEEWTQRPVLHFAFPSGGYDARVVRAIQEAGYLSAWSTEPRFRSRTDDRYYMPRVPIDDCAAVGILAAKMTAVMQRWSLSG